jgi:putative two-component system response regulator
MSETIETFFPKRVVLIDPEVIPCIPMIAANRENCWKIFIALDGLAGVTLAKETIPDLIVMGATLPGLNCFEVLQDLRSYPPTAQVPVIICFPRKSISQEPSYTYFLR